MMIPCWEGRSNRLPLLVHWEGESGQQRLMNILIILWWWSWWYGRWCMMVTMMITCSRDFRQEARTSSVGAPPLGSTPTLAGAPDPSSLSWGWWWSYEDDHVMRKIAIVWCPLELRSTHNSPSDQICHLLIFPFLVNVHFGFQGRGK